MEEYIKQVEDIISFLDDAILYADSDDYDMKKAQKDKMALKYLLKRYKELEQENKASKEAINILTNKLEKLEEENKQLKVNEEILMKTKGCLNEDNSTNCRVLDSLSYGIRAYEKTLRNSIPTSVIQDTLDDTNKNIEEFTKNVVTTKEEIEQEYWKSELNKAIAKRNVLQEILEEGRR